MITTVQLSVERCLIPRDLLPPAMSPCHPIPTRSEYLSVCLCVCREGSNVVLICAITITPLLQVVPVFIVCVCLSLSDCVFDLCAERGSAALRCASYEAYAAACQEAGIKLGKWRQQLDCGKKLNMHKKLCCIQNDSEEILSTRSMLE